jgi:ElaA protein
MITWQWSGFADLTVAQLYAMLALRQVVFVLE